MNGSEQSVSYKNGKPQTILSTKSKRSLWERSKQTQDYGLAVQVLDCAYCSFAITGLNESSFMHNK